MTRRRIPALAATLALATALVLAAAPVRAQTADGPVLPRTEFARLSRPAAFAPADLSSEVAALADGTRLNLLYSAPLAALLGIGGMVLGYGNGLVLFGCQDESSPCEHGPDDFEYTLAYTGLALGATTGAHLGGKTRDSKGSFWATLGGAAVGALPILLAPKDDDQAGAYVGSMVGGTAGAVLLDYLVRRPRR